MSFSRTARGAATSNASGSTLSISSLVLATGSSLLVFVSHEPVAVSSLKWNSIDLTKDVEVTNGTDIQGSIWSLHNVTGATATLTVTFASNIVNKSMVAAELIPEKQSVSLDTSATNTGTSGSPSSGASAALTYPAEFAFGAVGGKGSLGNIGTWQNSFTGGQFIQSHGGQADNISAYDGYFFSDATTALTAAETGLSSVPWIALIGVYKEGTPEVRVSEIQEIVESKQSRVQVTQIMFIIEYRKPAGLHAQIL